MSPFFFSQSSTFFITILTYYPELATNQEQTLKQRAYHSAASKSTTLESTKRYFQNGFQNILQ